MWCLIFRQPPWPICEVWRWHGVNYWPHRVTQMTYLASKQEWRPLDDRNINWTVWNKKQISIPEKLVFKIYNYMLENFGNMKQDMLGKKKQLELNLLPMRSSSLIEFINSFQTWEKYAILSRSYASSCERNSTNKIPSIISSRIRRTAFWNMKCCTDSSCIFFLFLPVQKLSLKASGTDWNLERSIPSVLI